MPSQEEGNSRAPPSSGPSIIICHHICLDEISLCSPRFIVIGSEAHMEVETRQSCPQVQDWTPAVQQRPGPTGHIQCISSTVSSTLYRQDTYNRVQKIHNTITYKSDTLHIPGISLL